MTSLVTDMCALYRCDDTLAEALLVGMLCFTAVICTYAASNVCNIVGNIISLLCCCQVSRKEMQATLALRFGGEGILKVKGIPFKAGAQDVRKFFSGYKIKPEGVSFIMHADGRPTGMAFIEFETPQEAVRAMVGAMSVLVPLCNHIAGT